MATVSVRELRKRVAAVLKGMVPGRPAPTASMTADQRHAVTGMIRHLVLSEYQKVLARSVRALASADGDHVAACLKGLSLKPLRVVGEGAYGAAWLTADRQTIVKIGEVGLANDPPVDEFFRKARREFAISRAAGDLGVSPRVRDAFFCCSDETCYYVIVMAFVPGVDLNTWHATASAAAREAMRVRVLDRVASLQAAGISHNDLHGSNVLVTPAGEPVIIDYGLATWTAGGPADAEGEAAVDGDLVNRMFARTETVDRIVRYVANALVAAKVIELS